MEDVIIGWTIVAGNPVDGFTHYGFYDTSLEAAETANGDAHLGDDWWIAPIRWMEN